MAHPRKRAHRVDPFRTEAVLEEIAGLVLVVKHEVACIPGKFMRNIPNEERHV